MDGAAPARHRKSAAPYRESLTDYMPLVYEMAGVETPELAEKAPLTWKGIWQGAAVYGAMAVVVGAGSYLGYRRNKRWTGAALGAALSIVPAGVAGFLMAGASTGDWS